MELSSVLMWVFVVIMVIGLWLTYRTITGNKQFKHKLEGPIMIAIGLLCSVLVGMFSGGETTEGFKSVYGLN